MADDLTDKGIKNEVEGSAKELKGRIRDGIADVTGDDSENLKGKAEKLEGKAQKHFGRAEQNVDDK